MSKIIQTSPFSGRTFERQLPARLIAAAPAEAAKPANQSMAMVQDANPALARYLRPQSAFQWWTLPYLSSITPQYVQNILIGALAGNHIPAWQLFDLMIDTNPEIAACIGEYVDGILEKKLIIEPYHEEDEQPSKNAIRNQKIVSAALRNMRPDPANDENAVEGTIRDILFGRFHGQSILEEDWFDTFGTGKLNTVSIPSIGEIAAPRATFWVHPVCYAYDVSGRLGLRLPPQLVKDQSKAARGYKPGSAVDVGSGAQMPWSGFTGSSRPDAVSDFPSNQFLISIFKAKAGSALGGSCLRPLAWWWVVSNFAGDWLLDLAQIFGIPFRKAKYKSGTPEGQKAEAREMLQNMGSRGWCLLDERVDVEFEKAIESGAQSPQGFLVELAERQFRKVILRQTMTGNSGTTGKGGGQAFGEVEGDVKTQCLNAGAKFACSVLREQFARHVLLNNLNDDSELPFIRLSEHEEGGLPDAQRDTTLSGGGLLIGENYLRKKYNIPKPVPGENTIGQAQPPANAPGAAPKPREEDPEKPQPGKGAKTADDELEASRVELQAGDVAGHEFHGNQYTDESLAAETQPLRKKYMLGDEVVFAKDGKAQRGYLGWKKAEGYEIEHAEVVDHPTKPGVKLLARTGEKSIVPADKVRMPKPGFKQHDFAASTPQGAAASAAGKGCLMAMVPEALAKKVLEWGQANVPDSELAPAEGRETEPHVTVYYGFDLEFDTKRLASLVAHRRPAHIELGNISRFECPDYDVLKIDVDSIDLENLHKLIDGKFENAGVTPSEHDYHPHLTLAYIKKGTCKDLDGNKAFDGQEFTSDTLLYSLPEKQGRQLIKMGSRSAVVSSVEASEKTVNAPSVPLQEKGVQDYSKAFAEDVQHVFERLQAILEIKDDAIFKKKLEQFYADYPSLKQDILADPASARALRPIIGAALGNGLATAERPAPAQKSKRNQ